VNGLVGWLVVVGVVVLLNRVLGRVVSAGRPADGGGPGGPGSADPRRPTGGGARRPGFGEDPSGGRPGSRRLPDPRLDPGFLREVAALAERNARSRAISEVAASAMVDRPPSRPASGHEPASAVGPGAAEIGVGPRGSSAPRGPAAGSAAGRLPGWPGRTALQRAVLYAEILGPPPALRSEGERSGGSGRI